MTEWFLEGHTRSVCPQHRRRSELLGNEPHATKNEKIMASGGKQPSHAIETERGTEMLWESIRKTLIYKPCSNLKSDSFIIWVCP